jgi:hypothetical protein
MPRPAPDYERFSDVDPIETPDLLPALIFLIAVVCVIVAAF